MILDKVPLLFLCAHKKSNEIKKKALYFLNANFSFDNITGPDYIITVILPFFLQSMYIDAPCLILYGTLQQVVTEMCRKKNKSMRTIVGLRA